MKSIYNTYSNVWQFRLIVFSTLYLLLFSVGLYAQVVSPDPAFPSIDNSITIFFDASEGDKGLLDHGGDVYIHTGLITDKSDPDNPSDPISNPGDWKYIKTDFGQNTASTKMTKLESNLYSITITDIVDYYGVIPSDEVLKIAMVFRSSDSEKIAKDEDGSDLFIEIFGDGTYVKFNTPSTESVFLEQNSTIDIQVLGASLGSELQSIELQENGAQLAQTSNDTLNFELLADETGRKELLAIATGSTGVKDSASVFYLVPDEINDAPHPAGVTQGIKYYESDPTRVTLSLLAPFKDLVYVIGEFNDWELLPEYQMNREVVSFDEVYWWVDITGLEPGKKYSFQYLVDNEIRIADPYAEEVLHPDDSFISEETYPDLKTYPYGKTSEYVSVIETDKEEFLWTDEDWSAPPKENLVIYELLVRDFSDKHDFQTVIDSLDYLESLGINAIELMPVNEFEGNNSWGYNPSFYFAVDRYYGPPEDLKKLVNEAHNRGIAVILDAVYNHSFGQSPMVRLYNEGNYGKPTSENIWFNTDARHPFNVGYDFDHSTRFTQQFIDSVNSFWVQEFHIDGFRYDLSKGFTQNFTSDVGAWNQYDQSRVDLLNRMKFVLHQKYPETYLILEHLGNNDEEKVLADSGFMLWGIMHDQYKDAALGFDGDLTNVSHKTRGWDNPHLVGYMESHDEERIMHELESFGNAFAGYDVKKTSTALNRIKLANAFLLTVPGPKMYWQFGEYGYDISINFNGRTGEKPILWNYLNEADRFRLYQTTAELSKLKTTHPSFATNDFEIDLGGKQKRILLKAATDVQVLGNFDVISADVWPYGHNSGSGKWWYDYFSGDSLFINEGSLSPINMQPGEFRMYSTTPMGSPPPGILNENAAQISFENETLTFNEISGVGNNPPFEKKFTVTNSGTAVLTITDITNFSSVFSASPVSASVQPGNSLDLTVTFNPPALGNYDDTFTIETSSIGNKSFSVTGNYADGLPAVPSLQTPGDAATNVQLNTTFTWAEISDADSYEIEIKKVQSETIIDSEAGLTDNRFTSSNVETDTEYSWKVRSANEFGNSPWSQEFTFTTIPSVPAQINLVSPESEATEVSTSPIFFWEAEDQATSYEIQVSTDETFTVIAATESGIEEASVQITGIDANTSYFWRVRGVNTTGNGPWSVIQFFSTSAIATPNLVSPANKSVNIALDSLMIWRSAESAESYTIQVAKKRDFKIRAQESGLTDTTFTPDFLEKNTEYFWRVRSEASEFNSGWSEIRSFLTPFEKPGKPDLLSPESGEKEISDEFILDWSSVDLALSYQLQISSEEHFSDVDFDSTGIAESKVMLKNILDRNTTYFWRVKGLNPTETGDWSDTLSFTTLPEKPAPTTLINPADSLLEAPTEITFKWEKGSEAESYRLQVSTTLNFTEKLDSVLTDTFFVMQDLEFNQTYYWRVKTTGSGGTGDWSEVRLFKTIISLPDIPSAVSPLNDDVVDPTVNRFIWAKSARVSTYQFQLSTSASFEELVKDSSDIVKQEVKDISLNGNADYFWRVRAKNRAGFSEWSPVQKISTNVLTSIESETLPEEYSLKQNYPNPFNPSTTIRYALPKAGKVTIDVFNMIGQKVATIINEKQKAGYHSVEFDASALASGMYIYRISAGSFSEVKKLTLIK